MEIFQGLLSGFSLIFSPVTLLYCFAGVFIGTLIGVLPGIGPTGAMSLLLPLTFRIGPIDSIIMLSGIYYGAMYGGSITSILVNIPGEAATVVTCLDGHQMAKKGRAGPALGISAIGSYIAGTFGVIGLTLLSPFLAAFALRIGPPEYFSLLFAGLTIVIYLTSGSVLRALMMALFGIILGCVGQDPQSGSLRFVFRYEFLEGIGLVPFVMGLFGISEILINMEKRTKVVSIIKTKIRDLFPSRQEWLSSAKPVARGTVLGFCLGILPGGGALISSFASYAVEKKFSKNPESFGTGAIEGVAGPESANNSATAGAFVPLLTLGIPSNVVMALLLGALIINGVTPGPLLLEKNPEVFWSVIASMYIGNIMLLILNLPLIGMWVQVLRVPYKLLFPLIILFCLIGAYSLNNSTFDIWVMLGSGLLGYLMLKYNYPMAPMVLAYVLGPMFERNLRNSLLFSDGSFLIFFQRPISAVFLGFSLLILVSALIPTIRSKRDLFPKEEEEN